MKTGTHVSEEDTISGLYVLCMSVHFLQERIAFSVTAKFCRIGMKTNMNCFYGNVQAKRSITAGKLVDIRCMYDIMS